jgi:2-keto-4-pentenoate hydratase/2-oxohepta-3-ene-1,7-dioic acid hydratase in catechol pathway
MRIIRYQIQNQAATYGWMFEDKVGELLGDPYGIYQRGEASTPFTSVRLFPPVQPGKIIGIGRNYADHAKEMGADTPDMPILFLKPPSAVIGVNDSIVIPPQSQRVEHEAELALVIGKQGRWIPVDSARQYILGYTIANDVTARDLQRRDGQWTRGKGFDTFCPLGPWIETEFDPTDVLITCHVNDELRQMASTRDMVFPIHQLVAYVSSVMTLNPGDVILTGTPPGVGTIRTGDIVKISIEGLGILQNPVTDRA